MPPSPADMEDIFCFTARAHHHLAERGLQLRARDDFDCYVRTRASIDYGEVTFPTLDPRWNRLGNGNAMWLHLMQGNDTVGFVAGRLLPAAESLHDLFATRRYWFGGPRPEWPERIDVLTETPLSIRGRITMTGGLWIAPSHRGTGLAGTLTVLARAMLAREFSSDVHVGMWLRHLEERDHGRKVYGYRDSEHMLRWHPGGDEAPIDLWAGHASPAETAALVRGLLV